MWLVGPTPERPYDVWAPLVADLLVDRFGLRGEPRGEALVDAVLESLARPDASPLPFFLVSWHAPAEVPETVHLGLVPRDPADLPDQWLTMADGAPVEEPIVEELEAPTGLQLRRSLAYAGGADGEPVVSARYAADTGHPDGVVLAHTAGDSPGDLLRVVALVDDLLRTVRVTDLPPAAS